MLKIAENNHAKVDLPILKIDLPEHVEIYLKSNMGNPPTLCFSLLKSFQAPIFQGSTGC